MTSVMENQSLSSCTAGSTTSMYASGFPSTSQPTKFPPPAGYTPPTQHQSATGFAPSPVECFSPNSGKMHHPATPYPEATLFHETPASPTPTFAVSHSEYHNSPMMCGPTPASTPVQQSFPLSPNPTNIEFATETYATAVPSSSLFPAAPPSTIKGNITSFVGKMTHNPEKQQAGNAMIASRKDEKAVLFEQKALEWDLKGNTSKAQRNREKAARCRQLAILKLQQPLTTPTNKTGAKMDKAARLDAKALDHESKGDIEKAKKCQAKAFRLRQKHGLSQPTSVGHVGHVAPIAPTL